MRLVSSAARWVRALGWAAFSWAALLCGGVSPVLASPVVVGDPILDRPINDGAIGSIFVLPDPTFTGNVSSWEIFDNDGPGLTVTPLILKATGPGAWEISGIGTTRISTGLGAQSFTLGLIAGSDAVGPGYYFGFHDGAGVNPGFNTGVIDWDNALDSIHWLGSSHAFLAPGQPKATALAHLGRTYSVQFTENVGTVVGDEPRRRPVSDTAVGSIFVLPDALPVGTQLSEWSFWDADDVGQSVTPLLVKDIGGGNYVVEGVGTTRVSNGDGGQSFPFGLVNGTDLVNPNYYLAFKDGSNGGDNDGVVDFTDSVPDAIHWLGPGHTMFGPGYTAGVMFPNLPRSYSIQGHFVEVVPEPGSIVLCGLGALGMLLAFRRR